MRQAAADTGDRERVSPDWRARARRHRQRRGCRRRVRSETPARPAR